MSSFKIVILCLAVSLTICSVQVCTSNLKSTGAEFHQAIQNLNKTNDMNTFIEDLASLTKSLPDVMDSCQDKFLADKLRKNAPDQCVDDISKALQISYKLIGETDNELSFAFGNLVFNVDLARLERIYDKKIKKECPSFQNVTLRQILKKGECAQASYDISVLVQNFLTDIERGQENKAVDDFIVVLQQLPTTLTACGQTDLADKISRDLPKECLTSIDVFGKALVELEYHYDHIEWIYKNFPRIYKSFKQITFTCPIFA